MNYLLFASSLVSCLLCAEGHYTESIRSGWGQTFEIENTLYEDTTDHQQMIIFENKLFGKVLALDGAIQITEKDEFAYQEMMAHVPLLAHGNAKKVLIIGGGDGGILREVLRHKTIEKVVLVEIDPNVISFSKQHLPFICQGSFENPKATVIIQDGSLFVKNTQETFDVIICDSTDPVGPGAVLFTSEFYEDCKALLHEDGIFVNQNGVPFLQPEEIPDTYKKRKKHFSDVGFYLAVIPTYIGGFMAFGWATNQPAYQDLSIQELTTRMENICGELKYYTPKIHKASFCLPKFIEDLIPSS